MTNLIRYSGPYGYILTVLLAVVLFLALRSLAELLRRGSPGGGRNGERLSNLLFWGTAAGLLGFLGQCHGIFLGLSAIVQATEIDPRIVAEGFAISFVPTLFGLGIFGISLACWGILRVLGGAPVGWGRLQRGIGPKALGLFFILLPVWGCGAQDFAAPGTLTEGVWRLEAGPDLFLWEFTAAGGGLACLVHAVNRGRKVNETPCGSAGLMEGTVTFSMGTGVDFEGDLSLAKGIIEGRLLYPDGSHMEAPLRWAPRSDFPSLAPLPNGDEAYSYRPPESREGGWPVAHAEEMGVSVAAVEEMVKEISAGTAGVLHSLLVVRGGRLIVEEYFHGYGPGDLHQLASVTKSVSSLLVGLAIQEGAISSVQERLRRFFQLPDVEMGDGWESLTLEHLLTMSMALDWTAEEADNLHATGPEAFRSILSRDVTGTPGEDWQYASINVNLLAGVLRSATGEHAEEFAERVLFTPLGIEAWDWEGLKTGGFNLMDGSLRLLPRDMAKLGALILNEGRWQGRAFLDPEWVHISTSPHMVTGDDLASEYGYLWWRMSLDGPDRNPLPVVLANGWGSQFIAIVPSLDLVVVTTGGNDYNGKHMAVGQLLARHLFPEVEAAPDS